MSSLFVMFKSFWMLFWEHETESVFSLSIIEETQVLFESIEDDVLEAKYEKTGFFIDIFEIWD